MKLDDRKLVKKYGSWVRVQVAFYDFIFQRATEMCPKHWKDKALKDIMEGFRDGEDIYEESISAIEYVFESYDDAWKEFLSQTIEEKK